MATPRFEFDPEKDRRNRERHGISFVAAQELWRVRHVVIAAKVVRGEVREAILGELSGKLWTALFATRGGVVRLISCHRADGGWERKYEKAIEEKGKHQADHGG